MSDEIKNIPTVDIGSQLPKELFDAADLLHAYAATNGWSKHWELGRVASRGLVDQLRSELEAAKSKSINRECLTEFVKAYESLKSGTDCAITDADVSNTFARAVEAVNQELRRTE